MTRSRPVSPALEFQRKQAKAQPAKAVAAGDPAALARLRQHHPRLAAASPEALAAAPPRLADAQLVLAREHRFESWPNFVHLQAPAAAGAGAVWEARCARRHRRGRGGPRATPERKPRPVPRRPASGLRLGGLRPDYSAGDAHAIIAREHHFLGLARSRSTPPRARAEGLAGGRVRGGGGGRHRRGERGRPAPAAARGPGARPRSLHADAPRHSPALRGRQRRRELPAADAEERGRDSGDPGPGRRRDRRGGGHVRRIDNPRPRGNESVHPALAGVQDALIDLLVEHGAAMHAPGSAGNGHSAVNGCLANGRGAAAEHLAGRGARLDLEGAAGVGRLDLVRSFFSDDGTLKDGASEAQMLFLGSTGRASTAAPALSSFYSSAGSTSGGATGERPVSTGQPTPGTPEIVRPTRVRTRRRRARRALRWHPARLGAPRLAVPPLDAEPEAYYEVALLAAAGSVRPERLAEKVRSTRGCLPASGIRIVPIERGRSRADPGIPP